MEKLPFWERVNKLTKVHNMSQEQFAGYIDVPISTYRGWIHYKRIPDAQTAVNIATALGVSVEYLVNGTDLDITESRLKELAARKAAGKMEALIGKMQQQVQFLGKPL